MTAVFAWTTVFAWIWILSGLLSLYFLALAAFSDGSWSHFFWAIGISVLAKGVARRFIHSDKRKIMENQLMSEGYTYEEAHEEYVRQLTTGEWSMERVEKIIQDYGGALERKSPGPNGMVADESQLPHPKKLIQMAILFMLEKGDLVDEQKDALIIGFFSLADFQAGVDDEDTSADIFSDEYNALPTEEKIRVVAQGGIGEKWLKIAEVEREKLTAQLKQEGHWHDGSAATNTVRL